MSHAEQVVHLYPGTKLRYRLQVLGRQLHYLAHRVNKDSYRGVLALELCFHDHDAGCFGDRFQFQAELYGQVHHRYNGASQVDDSSNPLGRLRNGRHRVVLDDLFHLEDADGVFLIGEKKGQILLLFNYFFGRGSHGLLP